MRVIIQENWHDYFCSRFWFFTLTFFTFSQKLHFNAEVAIFAANCCEKKGIFCFFQAFWLFFKAEKSNFLDFLGKIHKKYSFVDQKFEKWTRVP
jgi:hypothetical protein